MEPRWRFEPLRPPAVELGAGPFRVRGLAYMSMLEYVRTRTPGGMPTVERALEDDLFLPYFSQLFVALGDYDAAPLLALFRVASRIEGVPIGRFIELRSRGSARADSQGIWKPLLASKSLSQMVDRLSITFNRYYDPCRARIESPQPKSFQGELTLVPSSMNGLYAASTVGFVGTCLERAGASGVRFEWAEPSPSGLHAGFPVETLRFVARWSSSTPGQN